MVPFKKSASGSPDREKSAAGAAMDDFNARRSSRASATKYEPDNDNWIEALAVCEIPIKPGYGDNRSSPKSSGGKGGLLRKFKSKNNVTTDKESEAELQSPENTDIANASQRLQLRPYFQSRNTGKRVWDEPPSGASNIVYATPEARKMAQAQLEEMRSTYAQAAVKRRVHRQEKRELKETLSESKKLLGETPDSNQSKLSAVIPKVFKRGSSTKDKTDKVNVKGTLVLSDEGGRSGIPKSVLEESKKLAGLPTGDSHEKGSSKTKSHEPRNKYEADMQKAMLLSIKTSQNDGIGGDAVDDITIEQHQSYVDAKSSSSRQVNSWGVPSEFEEQMAMALSLSEQEAWKSGNDGQTPKANNCANGTSTKFGDDGGGKMPANQQEDMDEKKVDDFGDRGSSWELDWKQSLKKPHR